MISQEDPVAFLFVITCINSVLFVGPFLKVLCKVVCWFISKQKSRNLNERKCLERGFRVTPDLDNDAIPNHKQQREMKAKPELDMIKNNLEVGTFETEHDEPDDEDYLEITDDYIIKSPSSSLAS